MRDGVLTAPRYDVIVVGAGHAGCEAALAAARLGCTTLLLTLSLDKVAYMPCNPSIGGPGKGHLVREVDALVGEMGRAIDATSIQIRMLNTGKGPAVQALRAQADKYAYADRMKRTLEEQPHLTVKQAHVERLLVDSSRTGHRKITGVGTALGATYLGCTVVLATGTFLRGRIVIGDYSQAAGRAGEPPANALSDNLGTLGFRLGRLKTGTPPRIDARTIDYGRAQIQPGSAIPLHFSFANERRASQDAWLEKNQLPCFLVHTNARTHDIIRDNLHRAPMFNGSIQGVGPRYCPSIEDKIVRFADKESHGLFLEPEGRHTYEVYVQGANTSLPEDVQLAMLRSIPALEHVEMTRVGYAVEYDFVPPDQTRPSLETRAVDGLFLAGQINGSTGYEEAAAQGLIAGINAARKVRDLPPIILGRDQAYVGVLIDDLVTHDLKEPYRIMTCLAEHRLLLRQTNADLRLTALGHGAGLVGDGEHQAVVAKASYVRDTLKQLDQLWLHPTEENRALLRDLGAGSMSKSISAKELLRRPDVTYDMLLAIWPSLPALSMSVREEVCTEVKYRGYIDKQESLVARTRRMEAYPIPSDFDYRQLTALRREAREQLVRFAPNTLGQASRLAGVSPADVNILLVYLERLRLTRAGASPTATRTRLQDDVQSA
jgi:tRNA uridine 5-carboxymethylaminomethyl modification enzyme